MTNYAVKVNGDIDEIHKYFNQNYSQLTARGKSVDDVHTILFSAYKVVPDANFHAYIERLYDDWIDQTGDMVNATHTDLMRKAKQRFDLLTTNNKWGAKSPDQEKIIALEAQLKDLKLSAQLIKKLKNENKQGQKAQGKDKGDKADGNQGQGQTQTTRNKKNTSNKRWQKQDEAWKLIPPKDNEPQTRKIKNIQWHWCIHHMKWVTHSPNDCRVGKQKADEKQQLQAKQATTYASTLAQVALMAANE